MQENYPDLMVPLFTRLNGGVEHFQSFGESFKYSDAAQLAAPTPSKNFSQYVTHATILHMKSVADLREELLARVYAQSFQFFEKLVIDLLLAMGYGGGKRESVRHVGRSHDGGIDGIVQQDELGLDVILLQAKRLRPGNSISSSQVREFIGSMEACHSRKGVFFTTGRFTSSAVKIPIRLPHGVSLIDGSKLADLMIRPSIGTEDDESFVFKRVSQAYFSTSRLK
jgi:restriction system protein